MKFIAGDDAEGMRIDICIVEHGTMNRSSVKALIDKGNVTVNGETVKKCGLKLNTGDLIEIVFPEIKESKLKPYSVTLEIIYEDEDIVVINKPPDMVVHPGSGNSHNEDSLVNALLANCKGFKAIKGEIRPGIVHRLDKNTSGVIIVAKNDKALESISAQFKARTVKKRYIALVAGLIVPKEAIIDSPIGRDNRNRKKMGIQDENKGKNALTRYKYKKRIGDYSLIDVFPETGRTHQIRVHLAAIGFPVVGDEVYGKKRINEKIEQETGFKRQFLHAEEISFEHPSTGKRLCFKAKLADDLEAVLEALNN